MSIQYRTISGHLLALSISLSPRHGTSLREAVARLMTVRSIGNLTLVATGRSSVSTLVAETDAGLEADILAATLAVIDAWGRTPESDD